MQRLSLCIVLSICLVSFALVEAVTPILCKPCPRPESKEPVCAQLCSRRLMCTFASRCEARRQRCLNNENWRIVSKGKCKNPSSQCKRSN